MSSESHTLPETRAAVFDGEVFRLEEPFLLAENTRVTLTIEERRGPALDDREQRPSFLQTARQIHLDGPEDWAERFETYSYVREGLPALDSDSPLPKVEPLIGEGPESRAAFAELEELAAAVPHTRTPAFGVAVSLVLSAASTLAALCRELHRSGWEILLLRSRSLANNTSQRLDLLLSRIHDSEAPSPDDLVRSLRHLDEVEHIAAIGLFDRD